MNPRQQSKHWCFTCNNPISDLTFNAETVAYAVWQKEQGDSGTPHYQGYLQATKVIRLTGARKILMLAGHRNAHVEVKRGTVQQAVTYCRKEDTRVAGPFEFGELPITKQGERTDLNTLRTAVKGKRKWTDIADDDDLNPLLAKFHRYARWIRQEYELETQPKWRNVQVEVLWGPTGCGKTRKAMDEGAFKWNPCTPEWWDGYRGEEILLIDEFYGQIKPSRLLQLLDGHPCLLPIKGAATYAVWTKVYITSNSDPASWYTDIPPAVKAALQRRITKTTQMGTEPSFDFAANRDGNGTWGKF